MKYCTPLLSKGDFGYPSKGTLVVPFKYYPPNITPYCPIQPLIYDPHIGGKYVGMYLGYSPKGTQLFPIDIFVGSHPVHGGSFAACTTGDQIHQGSPTHRYGG